MELTKDGVRFASGREEYAHHGIFGLTKKLELTEGYDSFVQYYEDNDELTADEKVDLAEFMIARWREWAAIPRTDQTVATDLLSPVPAHPAPEDRA